MDLSLSTLDRRYFRELILQARFASQQCVRYSTEWRTLNAEIGQYVAGSKMTDPILISRTYGANLRLGQAMDSWNWWRRELSRIQSLIACEFQVRQMFNWGDPAVGDRSIPAPAPVQAQPVD